MNDWLSRLQRRDFLKVSAAAAAGALLPACGLVEETDAESAPRSDSARKGSGRKPVNDVLPIIGTGWHGHMFPAR